MCKTNKNKANFKIIKNLFYKIAKMISTKIWIYQLKMKV